jgi:hypothetical protein
MDRVMIDIATDLRERFDFAALWYLARHEVLPDKRTMTDLSDEDAEVVRILETLRDTADAIPPSLLKATETLHDADPEKFETTLLHGVRVVGFGFSPTCATNLSKY